MTDKQQIAYWKRIKDPKKALEEIVKNETLLGYDPYYCDLRSALLEMAERCSS